MTAHTLEQGGKYQMLADGDLLSEVMRKSRIDCSTMIVKSMRLSLETLSRSIPPALVEPVCRR